MLAPTVIEGALVLTFALLTGFTTSALLVRWIGSLFEAGKGRST